MNESSKTFNTLGTNINKTRVDIKTAKFFIKKHLQSDRLSFFNKKILDVLHVGIEIKKDNILGKTLNRSPIDNFHLT